jgi:hypothetical protein
MWSNKVVGSWFCDDDETADDFLLRGSRFLRDHIRHSMCILQGPEKTQSYVAFMRITSLASLLLFEFLAARKWADTASSGPAVVTSCLFHGFCMFVSSSRRVFSLTPADVPALGARPTVLQGLRCLSRLSAPAWELLGPMKAEREYVEEEAQAVEENADICLKPEDFDSDKDESGANDSPLLTAPKAKEAELEARTEVSDQNDLFQACAGGHLEIVKRLVEQARVLLTAETKNGSQPIHIACFEGHLELVKWLADEGGVSLTAQDNDGWQPIHCACDNGHLKVVKWLAEQDRVSLTAEANDGEQPIHCACCKGHLELGQVAGEAGRGVAGR